MNKGVKIPTIGIPGLPGEKDYVVGSTSKIAYEARCDDWTPYFKIKENQFTSKADFQSCVSESFVHSVEAQFEWAKAKGKFTQRQLKEMRELNYFDKDDNFNFSARFIAKISGTDRTGNTQNAVAEAGRKYGLVGDTDWPNNDSFGWNEYYTEIPLHIKIKAQRFFDFAEIAYEWVMTNSNPAKNYQKINVIFDQEVKQAPIQITYPICPSYSSKNGPYATCSLVAPEHASVLFRMFLNSVGAFIRKIWDSYPPYSVEFQNNYPIPYGLKILMTPVIDTSVIVNPETREALPNYPKDAPLPPVAPEPLLVRLWHKLLANYFFNKFSGGLFTKR